MFHAPLTFHVGRYRAALLFPRRFDPSYRTVPLKIYLSLKEYAPFRKKPANRSRSLASSKMLIPWRFRKSIINGSVRTTPPLSYTTPIPSALLLILLVYLI